MVFPPLSKLATTTKLNGRSEELAIGHTAKVALHNVYGDCTTIDWGREYGKERLRVLELKQQRGLRGAAAKLWDGAVPWIVISVGQQIITLLQ